MSDEQPKKPEEPVIAIESFPENASVKELGTKPSVWKEFWMGCHDLFWQWYGLDKIAEDINKHGEAVRKGAALRFLLIIALLALFAGFGIKGCVDSSAFDSFKDALSKVEGAKGEAERDRDKYQTLYNQDENTIGPLRQIANSKYAQAPPDQRVDILLKRLESLQDDVDSKIQSVNPLNQNIAVATVEINIVWKTDAAIQPSAIQQPPQGDVLAVCFGKNQTPLLIAGPANGISMRSGNSGHGWASLSTTFQLAPNSPTGFPIENLRQAEFIQIEFTPPDSTILGGKLRWTINSNTVLEFDIPPQMEVGTHVVVRDLRNGLKPLSIPPDNSASPN